jgi:predicted phosphodiesterase
VRSTFEHTPRRVVRVVALHHPLSLGGFESIANRAHFERALVDAEIDIVLAGHTHQPKVKQLLIGQGEMNSRTIVEVVAGTATSHRTRGTERSWSQLLINRNEVTITEHVDSGAGWHVGRSQTISLAVPKVA